VTSLQEYLQQDVLPHAARWDREECLPRAVLAPLAGIGVLAANIAPEYGGRPCDPASWGEMLEVLGEASMSLLSVVTVHAMCSHAISRWGEPAAQREWLPGLASGALLGGFALSEPAVGSDAKHVEARLDDNGDQWRLNGRKRWISAGQLADVFLVLGQTNAGPTAVLVPRDAPGLTITPIGGMLGFRAAQPCELIFQDVPVPKARMIGPEGMGFSYVAGSSLDVGRFCIACGCTGLIKACLHASVDYARTRKQFGVALREHQLIQAMLADMATGYKAARALWRQAAEARSQALPSSIVDTATAKYFAATAASRAADNAVQIHGANGCGPDYPVQRYFRDARVGEIIEGSNQMQQIMLAHDAIRSFATPRPARAAFAS
jgi:alkylation response protein AidB-like acyl-CoA dehydrogenase